MNAPLNSPPRPRPLEPPGWPDLAAAAVLVVAVLAIFWPMALMRAHGLTFARATAVGYYPPDLLTFFFPWACGDPGCATYRGGEVMALFWEDYGSLGLLSVVLALFAAVRLFRRWRSIPLFAGVVIVWAC